MSGLAMHGEVWRTMILVGLGKRLWGRERNVRVSSVGEGERQRPGKRGDCEPANM